MKYLESKWNFLNMNSPADLNVKRIGDSVSISEYNRCRDGHALLSNFYVESKKIYFRTNVKELGEGIGVGLYFGDGCFDNYMLVCVDENSISIRVPNGVPLGDTFRIESAKRYYEIARNELPIENFFEIAFKISDKRCIVYYNNIIVLDVEKIELPFKICKDYAKLIIKALNYSDSKPLSNSIFGDYYLDGLCETHNIIGKIVCDSTKKPLENIYVHIADEYDLWCKTDKQGEFYINDLPYGKYNIVCCMEGQDFQKFDIIHNGDVHCLNYKNNTLNLDRENIPQLNLKNNLPYIGMNGLWKFSFDKLDVGETEKWFIPNNYDFPKCIKVPFSWKSLMAFGHENLQDDFSLHQANTYTCTQDEIGKIGWYQKTFTLNSEEAEKNIELFIGAITGLAKVWLDDKQIGCVLDTYNHSKFNLGRLTSNKLYTITIKVEHDQNNNFMCLGKQGFWFTDSPGIWQNVWLQQRDSIFVEDVLIEYTMVEQSKCKIDFEINMDIDGTEVLCSKVVDDTINFNIEEDGLFKILLEYVADKENYSQLYINDVLQEKNLRFYATYGDYYDKSEFYFYFKAGENKIHFMNSDNNLQINNILIEKIQILDVFELYIDDTKIADVVPAFNKEERLIKNIVTYNLENTKFWSSSNPFLYKITLKHSIEEIVYYRNLGIRMVDTYTTSDDLNRYITINETKTYIRGVMDQGYNPWGIYTYPRLRGKVKGSAEYDILMAKDSGYNLIRMHVKNNEPDWYNICDEHGVLVWDETTPNFYGVAEDERWISFYKKELNQVIKKQNYYCSIIIHSVYNESWGITGNHEKSPWDNELGQRIIKTNSKLYKEKRRNVLAIDNSGYTKTSLTQLIDYHVYPSGYTKAKEFFKALYNQNFKNSNFNFFNSENKILMQNNDIRNLLQPTCSQDLKNLNFIGEETQDNQPILISEFVHTDKIEELVRIFPKFSGYIRMNIASQENEDTSPYTASRAKRTFGFVKDDFTDNSYQYANSEDLIFLDYPFLSKVYENDITKIPIYIGLWSDCFEYEKVNITWSFIGIDYNGEYKKTNFQGSEIGVAKSKATSLFYEITQKIPCGYKGGYLFVKLIIDDKEITYNYIQFEIFKKETKNQVLDNCNNRFKLLPEDIISKKGFYYSDVFYQKNNYCTRSLLWLHGSGELTYKIPFNLGCYNKATLILEMSDCKCIQGTRETDENLNISVVDLFIQDIFVESLKVKEQSCDKKALFSNSSSTYKNESTYSATGLYGYGTRIEVVIPNDILEKINIEKEIMVKLISYGKGINIYGDRMGMYGCDPYIILE